MQVHDDALAIAFWAGGCNALSKQPVEAVVLTGRLQFLKPLPGSLRGPGRVGFAELAQAFQPQRIGYGWIEGMI